MINMQEIIVNEDEEKNRLILVTENGKIIEKYEEFKEHERLEGNIYIGIVKNILIGMQAAFVNIGMEKNTFIHIRDIIPKVSDETGNKNELLSNYDIKKHIKVGMPILVQVKRDSTNKKGARVSTHINLSGRFAVIMPNENFITISQKIENQNEKDRLKEIARKVLPDGYGAIMRTAAEGIDSSLIEEDMKKTIEKLEKILKEYQTCCNTEPIINEPKIIYKNEGMVHRLLFDLADMYIDRIWTNKKSIQDEIKNILCEMKKEYKIKVECKEENLLDMYDLDDQLEKLNNRKIWLKCGGFITIDKTEALTAIDVNSGKYIGTSNLEQTVFIVNKEASIEIAKQLRLRDIGGIIIIDYIDMEKEENREKITAILEENLKKDRSKTQVLGFTQLNLLEMTRKHMCSND